jgi:uncharacterized LabA/DUF88 family protein
MVVDAMDLATSKGHITTFVICSGDSDFSPLVSKLRRKQQERDRRGCEELHLRPAHSNCDEFIFYEDLRARDARAPSIENPPEKKRGSSG